MAVAQTLVAAQEGELTFSQTEETWQATIVLPTAQPPTILIIDDNEDLLDLFRRYLAGHRLAVVGANSGHAGAGLAGAAHPSSSCWT